jgi:hypothetical protein
LAVVYLTDYFDNPATAHAKAEVYRLDSTTPPQIILTFFTGGAHCCEVTKIITSGNLENWHEIKVDEVDGNAGYAFRDLEGNGVSELVGVDGSFYYAFDSYAGSYAPTRILKLIGTELKDVTRDSQYRGYLLSELRHMEAFAKIQNAQYGNGYFAGWIAQNALIGQLDSSKNLAPVTADLIPSSCG